MIGTSRAFASGMKVKVSRHTHDGYDFGFRETDIGTLTGDLIGISGQSHKYGTVWRMTCDDTPGQTVLCPEEMMEPIA